MTQEYSVTFFRLDNGEDIIADSLHVLKDDMEEEHYILDNPMKVIYLASGEDRRSSMSISLMQWIFPKISSTNQFKIKANKVLTTSEPTENLINFYFETLENLEKYRLEKEKEDKMDDIENEEFEDYSEEDALKFMEELMEHLKNTKKTLH